MTTFDASVLPIVHPFVGTVTEVFVRPHCSSSSNGEAESVEELSTRTNGAGTF
jgi:hypothetical protein